MTAGALAAPDWRPWGAGAVVLGATAGAVLGPLAQVVTALVVLRPAVRRTARARGAVVAVPVLLAVLLCAGALAALRPSLLAGTVAAGLGVASTCAVAVATRPWCLAPLR